MSILPIFFLFSFKLEFQTTSKNCIDFVDHGLHVQVNMNFSIVLPLFL